jgi:hypothetical protein
MWHVPRIAVQLARVLDGGTYAKIIVISVSGSEKGAYAEIVVSDVRCPPMN